MSILWDSWGRKFNVSGDLVGIDTERAADNVWFKNIIDRAPWDFHKDKGCRYSPRCLDCQEPYCRKEEGRR